MDEVVGARGQAVEHGLAIVDRGEHHQRDVAHHRSRLDSPASLLPSHPGHHEVEQDAIHGLDPEQLECLFTRTGEGHVVSVGAQGCRDRIEVGDAVVDSEDLARAERADRVGPRRLGRRSQHRGEACEDDVGVFFLANESVGSRIERAELGAAIVGTGEEHARRGAERMVEPQAADHRRSVDTRQDAVDDDRARAPIGCEPQALLSRGGEQHRIAGRLEQLLQLLAISEAIVDDEHRGADR